MSASALSFAVTLEAAVHWRLPLLAASALLFVTAVHRGHRRTVLIIPLFLTAPALSFAVALETAIHWRLPLLTLTTLLSTTAVHWRLSHRLASCSDGIALTADGYRFTGGTDRHGIRFSVFQVGAAEENGVKTLGSSGRRIDFFSAGVGNFHAVSRICRVAKVVNDAGLCGAAFIKSLEHTGVSTGYYGSTGNTCRSVVVNWCISTVGRAIDYDGTAGYVQVSVGVDTVSSRNNFHISAGDIDRDVYGRAVFGLSCTVDAVIGGLNGNIAAFYIYGDAFQTFIGFLNVNGTVFYCKGIVRMKRIVSGIHGNLSVFYGNIALGVKGIFYSGNVEGTVFYRECFLSVQSVVGSGDFVVSTFYG